MMEFIFQKEKNISIFMKYILTVNSKAVLKTNKSNCWDWLAKIVPLG